MKKRRPLKQGLAQVFRLWQAKKYDAALGMVEGLLEEWPGCSSLYLAWASLVQLQENPGHNLDEVKKALQQAADLDKESPAALIELGHFLDAVEDNPRAAAKALSEAIALARRFLIEGLLGQAKTFLQLNQREKAVKCLMELLYLAEVDSSAKRGGSDESTKTRVASKIEDLLKEAFLNRSA